MLRAELKDDAFLPYRRPHPSRFLLNSPYTSAVNTQPWLCRKHRGTTGKQQEQADQIEALKAKVAELQSVYLVAKWERGGSSEAWLAKRGLAVVVASSAERGGMVAGPLWRMDPERMNQPE